MILKRVGRGRTHGLEHSPLQMPGKVDPGARDYFQQVTRLTGGVPIPQWPPMDPATDLAMVKEAVAERTPEQAAIAEDLGQNGYYKIWKQYAHELGERLGDRYKAAEAEALVGFVIGYAGTRNFFVKLQHGARRPYQVDPTIPLNGKRPFGSSYPSGHTAAAYAAATLLGEMWPERKAEFLQAAVNIAQSRVVNGDHFFRDLPAGARIGMRSARLFSVFARHLQVPPDAGTIKELEAEITALLPPANPEPTPG